MTRRLLLVGGGHAHLGVLAHFAVHPIPGWTVTLLSSFPRQIYSGMLPGWVAGHYRIDDCSISLVDLCARATVGFHAQTVRHLNLRAGTLETSEGQTFAFDILSIDTGSNTATHGITDATEHALPIRPIEAFVGAWPGVVERWKTTDSAVDFAIVGSGAAAVELAFAIRHRAAIEKAEQVRVTLIGRDAMPLQGFARSFTKRAATLLRERGIGWRGNSDVIAIHRSRLSLASGESLPFDHCLLATGAAAPAWPAEAGLATDAYGFIRVDSTLASVSHAHVFATGDIAALPDPRPKSGVYAVRAAPILAANLAAACGQGAARHWTPRPYALYLLSTGNANAILSWRSFSATSPWLWRLKDSIDRGFVRRYENPNRTVDTG